MPECDGVGDGDGEQRRAAIYVAAAAVICVCLRVGGALGIAVSVVVGAARRRACCRARSGLARPHVAGHGGAA